MEEKIIQKMKIIFILYIYHMNHWIKQINIMVFFYLSMEKEKKKKIWNIYAEDMQRWDI